MASGAIARDRLSQRDLRLVYVSKIAWRPVRDARDRRAAVSQRDLRLVYVSKILNMCTK